MFHVAFIFVFLATSLITVDCKSTCCGDGWLAYNGSCYMFYDEIKLAWMEAMHFCQAHHSDLVVIETENENRFLKYYARKLFNAGNQARNTTAFWIGASDSDIEGIWKWVGPDVELTYTDPHFQVDASPDNREDCVAMNGAYNFDWHDGVCSVGVGYPLCEIRSNSNINGGVAMVG